MTELKLSQIPVVKYHHIGNDFVIIDGWNLLSNALTAPRVVTMACRRKGLGFDQLIWFKRLNQTDMEVQFYNSDGSQSGQCLNGMLSLAFSFGG